MQTQIRMQRSGCNFKDGRLARRSLVCVRAQNESSKSLKDIARRAVSKIQIPNLAKPAAIAAITNLITTLPAHAEAGKIFDFNLTLPIMIAEFLILMVFLEKTWFTPVGKVLDARDKELREKLGSVKDNSSELEELQKKAEELISQARAEASAEVQQAKKETEEEIQKAADEKKKELDAELEKALATLQKEQDQAIADVDSKVEKLVEDVLRRVLPEGVKV